MTISTIPIKSTVQRSDRKRTYRRWTFFVPGLSVLLFALLITLPWGFGADTTYVPPLLIAGVIFAWTVRRPTLIPSVLVFLVGVATDVVTASPVGYWAFLFLVSYACALHVARWDFEWVSVATIIAFLPVSIVVGLLAWALTSAYFAQVADWQTIYESVQVTWFVWPLVALFTRWSSNWMMRTDGADATGAGAA